MRKWMTQIRRRMETVSLRKRITILFAVSTIFLLTFTAILSYFTMSNMLTNKLQDTFHSNLKQIRLSLENTIDDMNYVSQQIAFSKNLAFNLENYLTDDPSFERAHAYDEIKNELNTIIFTNPNIGLSLLYVEKNDDILFYSQGLAAPFSMDIEPVLYQGYQMNNYGPHRSKERYQDKYVLSTLRKLDMHHPSDIYIYLESNLDLTTDLLEVNNVLNDTEYILINKEREIIYSENEDFIAGQIFDTEEDSRRKEGYYWFEETTEAGWGIVALIPAAQYNAEVNQWIQIMIYIVLIFVIISLIASFILWKNIHKPLREFSKEITLMGNSNFHSEVVETKIPEFAELIEQFRDMKKQITQLIKEIEQKERKRADLEVEKLIHQINPHFLMNTLDTAKWLAMSGERKELSQLLSSLNKILYYNLGKLGTLSSLEEELDAMEQYIKLQQIRYDFTYKLQIDVEERVLYSPVPRFILQPLVENAIYHGLVDDGEIFVQVKKQGTCISISVQDNGRGMNEEKVMEILHEKMHKESKIGMGIGLNYVKRIIDRTYDHMATIEVETEIGKGTKVILKIPYIKGGGQLHD
ncbi:sensor histidine kinase [Gracilibacillus alcaliphilus]|uniref:sensor histidine kinase n=1 Tax=Gracilibacillus alcaliphilus TaxID=1401441 RepID=UPI00195AA438|nr:sensor histidine kinase [Gracilibacillus alcaliphilus]MBM7679489.1 two-component system sensor histidine kinase YesM [Gracilibacillus alcaliphilus]